VNSKIHLEAIIRQAGGLTWRLRLSELRVACGGRSQASLEMQLESLILLTWRP